MGCFITVTRGDGTVILNRWSDALFFFDMVEDPSPGVGVNTYTAAVVDDGNGTTLSVNPSSMSLMVVKR